MHKIPVLKYMLLVVLSAISTRSIAQTIVRGAVTDAKNGDPIPFVNVFFEGTNEGKTTDFNGQYFIQSDSSPVKIRFSILGYKTEYRDIKAGESQIISVKMTPEAKELKAVTIKAEKKKYKNKNNPAVELIQLVIDHKNSNRKEAFTAYQYEKYEKVQYALSNISEKFMKKKYMKKFQFVFDNLDSNQMPGKVILPLYLKETVSDVYYRKDPKGRKEITKASRHVDFEDFINNDGLGTFSEYLYQDINIYDNSVLILTNYFISPIANEGPLFYKYYIKDTVMVDDKKCYHMAFYPRNKSDFIFQGELYITFDTNYAVRKCEMTVSPDINLNWVKELTVTQEFKEVREGEWLINSDNISIDFGIGKNGMGMYGQRYVSYKDFLVDQPKPDSFFKGEEKVFPDSTENRNDAYWDTLRHKELTASENGVYQMMDSIQHIPAFKRAVNILTLVFAGYEDLGLVELGPVSSFYSYNPIEGSRIRFGGRTTDKFNPKLQFEGYACYAFGDEQWKYYMGTRIATGKKKVMEFPMKNINLFYQYDTRIPGQDLQFVQEDNALLSIKRGVNDKLLYNTTYNASYLSEFPSHFSFDIGFQYIRMSPAGSLYFNTVDYNDPTHNVNQISTTPLQLTLRYAPNEQFYQGKQFRRPMPNKYPIMEVHFSAAKKDVFHSDYTYQSVVFSVFKQFNLAPVGYTHVTLETGKVFGTVPYPLLMISRANQTFSYQLQSYNLMNFMEFINDEYVAVNIAHYFNGFFFNKIPVFYKLKWREVVTMKAVWGAISDENNPDKNPGLFKLPVARNGEPISHSLQEKPYIEASVGIANIFKLIRVDLIKRFTYLEHPGVAEYGIRARAKLDF
jgi:hypothetical protein